MSVKISMAIFLFGLLLGIAIGFFTEKKFQDPILSISQSKVLGVTSEDLSPKRSWFGDLLNESVSTISGLLKDGDSLFRQELVPAKFVQEKETKSGKLTIAVLGDSMVDTMGQGLPYLEEALKKFYPNYQFNLLNYGAAGTNIEYGIYRLTFDYDYIGKRIPSLVSSNPDIVIIESFAYNPWGTERSDLDRHWLAMSKVVDILRSRTHAKIILLATIAPNKTNFGVGPGGVNWDKTTAWAYADKVSKYLDNTVRFALSQNLPIIDAYHQSIKSGDGNLAYISLNDHIHPSVLGCQFIANLIVAKLNQLGWI